MLTMVATAAHAAKPNDFDQISATLSATARINNNCSAQVIYSDRDRVSGEVKTLVLTARHCVEGAKDAETQRVEFFKYDARLNVTASVTFLADVIGKSSSSDIALLRLRDKQNLFPAEPIALESADAELYVGEDTLAVGFPLATSATVTRGTLGPRERIAITGKEVPYQRNTAGIAGGSSGGGLYHTGTDGKLKLIGIATAGVKGVNFVNYYTTVDSLHEYLKVIAPEAVK